MRSLTTFPALFLLLLMAVTPVSIAWSANRPDTGSDPPSLPAADGGHATVLSTTVLQPSSPQDGDEAAADSPPAVNGDASSPYPDGKSGDDVTDDPSTDQQLSNSDVASPASSEDAETEETEEDSSALPLDATSAVETTPIDDYDLPENEDVSSSTSPVDDSTVVAPSELSSENVDPSPQKSISDDTAGSSNSTESLSAAELKANLDVAEALEATAKGDFDTATVEFEKKKGEAIEPNRDYEEKKQKWEELEGIAVEKEKAVREYNAAVRRLGKLQTPFNTAETNYKTVNESLQRVADELVEMPKWPTELSDKTPIRDAKNTQKLALEGKIDGFNGAVDDAEEPYRIAETNYNHTKEPYDDHSCTGLETVDPCKGLKITLDGKAKTVRETKLIYDAAVAARNGNLASIATLKGELDILNPRIAILTSNIQKRTETVIKDEETAFRADQILKKEAFDAVKAKKDEAEGNVKTTKEAKEAAERSEGGLPAEARGAASLAEGKMNSAKHEKIAKDKEVTEAQNALAQAESSYKDAQAVVARLTNRYDAQKRKEDEAQRKRSLAAILGGIGGAVAVLIIAGIVGYLVWRKVHKPKARLLNSRTPGKRTRINASGAGTPLLAGSTSVHASSAGGATPSATTGTPTTNITQPTTTPLIGTPNGTPSTQGQPPAQDVFIPGEQPYKIPAKHFKWCGPLRRKSRWHGAPDHDFEGVEGVKKVDKIVFDPSACTATEIGQNEIIEDAGPASDSNRSEFLNNLDEWEKNHKIYMAQKAAEKEGKGNGSKKIEDNTGTNKEGGGNTGANPEDSNPTVPKEETGDGNKIQTSSTKNSKNSKNDSKRDKKGNGMRQ